MIHSDNNANTRLKSHGCDTLSNHVEVSHTDIHHVSLPMSRLRHHVPFSELNTKAVTVGWSDSRSWLFCSGWGRSERLQGGDRDSPGEMRMKHSPKTTDSLTHSSLAVNQHLRHTGFHGVWDWQSEREGEKEGGERETPIFSLLLWHRSPWSSLLHVMEQRANIHSETPQAVAETTGWEHKTTGRRSGPGGTWGGIHWEGWR